MTAREWKPGDVAMATFDHGGTGLVFRVIGAPSDWCDMAGVCAPAGQIKSVRPLVVIDPEDREQVARLVTEWQVAERREGTMLERMQAALREFANPAPPKPEEPTGLGAVVEDAKGEQWVRVNVRTGTQEWRCCDFNGEFRNYAEIHAAHVLSEGVTA